MKFASQSRIATDKQQVGVVAPLISFLHLDKHK